MDTTKTRERMYGELATILGRFRDIDQKLSVIRRYKRRESLRIALCDLLHATEVETTILEMTNLAEAALQHCYEIGRDQIMKPKFGTPLNEDGTAPCRFAVIGMGKLGGFELNFSSDIDLIFVYSDEGKTDEGVDNSEYYTRLCEFIIKAMSEVTVEGVCVSCGYPIATGKPARATSSVLWKVTKATMKGGAICGNDRH